LREDLSVWDLAHEEFDNNLELLHLDSEGFGSYLWSLSQCLDKPGLRLRILQLHSFDSSQIIKVSRILVIRNVLWEVGFDDELSGLLIQIL
jgi:hypothetical protein